MILMIDNYDSFTYNLVQYLQELHQEVKVLRNDAVDIAQIHKLKPSRIVISPGPGRPENAGISCEVIRQLSGVFPILGVCLGHQAIGYVFGAKVILADKLMHGKVSSVFHEGKDLFKNVENPFTATRYHSLLVEKKTLPSCLRVSAWTKEQEIMGLTHTSLPVWGVQFHPESIMTQSGKTILKNFLNL